MTHLFRQDRCKIENFLNSGLSLRKIGESLQKSHTTISREIKKRRIVDEASKRHRKNFCTFKNNCMKRTLCKTPPPTCKNRCSTCSYFSCNELCSDFIEDYCDKLSKAPYVCNGCSDMKKCKKSKYFYCANNAMNEYKTLLVQSRQGIDVFPSEIKIYNNLIKSGVQKGQSIHHVRISGTLETCHSKIYQILKIKPDKMLKKIVKDDKLRYSPEELLNRIVSFHSDFWTHITKNYNLPDEFLIQFQNYIDWNAFIEKHFPNIELIENIASIKFWEKISIYQNLDKNFIDKYKEKLNWSSISKYQILDSDDLNKYKNFVDWYNISAFQNLDIFMIREYRNELCWSVISYVYKLDSWFLNEFKDFVDWNIISEYQEISEECIDNHKDKLNWELVCKFQKLSEEVIWKNRELMNWNQLLLNESISNEFLKEKVFPYLLELAHKGNKESKAKVNLIKNINEIAENTFFEIEKKDIFDENKALKELLELKKTKPYFVEKGFNDLLSRENINELLRYKPKDRNEFKNKINWLINDSDPDQLEIIEEDIYRIIKKIQ